MARLSARLTAALLAAPLLVGGCSTDGDKLARTLGFARQSPDEFTVTTRAPLQIPADFKLEPPRPGAPRPQEVSLTSEAEAALVPSAALASSAAGESPGQQALVAAAGPAPPPNIRRTVDSEIELEKPKQDFTDKLAFWKDTPPLGTALDPIRETQRLRAEGKPVSTAAALATPPGKPTARHSTNDLDDFLNGLLGSVVQ
jgi:hypothetical protein